MSATGSGPRLLGVDGRSGSGKTHLAADVADELRRNHASVVIVSMDDMYPGWEGLAASLSRLCEHVIAPLSRGRPAEYQRYDWGLGRFADTVQVPLADAVVIEGVGSTAHPSRSDLSTTVWVHAPPSVRMDRACRRTDQGDFAVYADRWSAQEEELFGVDAYPQAPFGYDFVVDTAIVLGAHRDTHGTQGDG